LGELLAAGVEEEISKRNKRYVNLSSNSRKVYTWVGRAPKNEKEQAEMSSLKATFDLAICRVIEGEPFQSFYSPHDQVIPKREEALQAQQPK
jgi:hypothetical protein